MPAPAARPWAMRSSSSPSWSSAWWWAAASAGRSTGSSARRRGCWYCFWCWVSRRGCPTLFVPRSGCRRRRSRCSGRRRPCPMTMMMPGAGAERQASRAEGAWDVAAGAEDGVLHGPMHQFEINRLRELRLFGFDASFTNASLFMLIAVALIVGFLMYAMRPQALVPGRTQSVAEVLYEYVAGMVRENLGEEGMKFFPWVFSLFSFILV